MAYGDIKYHHEYYDRGNNLHRLEILAKDYSGESTLITHSAGHPVVIKHTGGKQEDIVIQGKGLQFSFFSKPGDNYDAVFASDYKDYKVRYYISSVLEFEGWLMPENLSREFFKGKYIINLSATDGLAKLRDIELRDGDDIISGKKTLLEIIKYAVANTGITLDFRIQLGTYESNMSSDECALNEIGVDARRFIKDGKPLPCHDVIHSCLKDFSCTLKQEKGYYQITNKHELDSYEFVFDYATLTQQSRTATSKIIDMDGYKYGAADMNKISPLKDVEIKFKNRDLGGDISGVDLTDWDNVWTIMFDEHSIAGGAIILWDDLEYNDDYIELKNTFAATNSTDNDYITVSFDYKITYTVHTNTHSELLIRMAGPNSGFLPQRTFFADHNYWQHIDTKIAGGFRIYETGNYKLRISFTTTEPSYPGNYIVSIKNVTINKIINPNETSVPSEVTIDQLYKQTSGKNVNKLTFDAALADGGQVTEIGSLLHNNATLTTSWKSYGQSEEIQLLDIFARNILNDRYGYKNYLKLDIFDEDNTIDMDNILLIQTKYYTFASFERDCKMGIIRGDIVELLTTRQSYDDIERARIQSVDGSTMNATPNSTQSYDADITSHNDLYNIQGGTSNEYYHLTSAEHTELSDWLGHVVLGNDGAINMEGELKVDTINEHSNGVGVTIDGVLLKDNKMNWSYVDGRPTTLSGYGISDTKAHFNTALSDGNFGFASGANHQIAFMSGTTALQYSANLTFDDATKYLYVNGRVGIGTDNPVQNLEIFGTVAGAGLAISRSGYQKWQLTTQVGISSDYIALSTIDTDGTNISDKIVVTNAGYVGIGTTASPAENLEVAEIADSTATHISILYQGASNINPDADYGSIKFNYKGDAYDFLGAEIAAQRDDDGGSDDSALIFRTRDGTTLNDVMKLAQDGNVEHPDFTSGFQGTNWQITADGDAEFRDVLISGGLQVYELIINRLRYQNGGLIIGAGAGKIKTVHVATKGSEQLEFEDPEGTSMVPFTVGAIVMCQDVNINRTTVVKKIVRQVASVAGQVITFTTTAGWVTGDDTGAFTYGDEVVTIGHVSDTNYDANIYMSAVDSDNPFMRIYDGVDSYSKWSLGDKTCIKVQLGNLASLANYDIIPADPGYGLYSDNVYLKGKIEASSGEIGGFTIDATSLKGGSAGTTVALVPGTGIHMGAAAIGDAPFSVTNAGVLKAVSGTIGGWSLDSDAIYTGTKHTSDDFSADGITFASDGSLHGEQFYINSDGEAAFKVVDQLIYRYRLSDNVITVSASEESSISVNVPVKIKEISWVYAPRDTIDIRIAFDMKIDPGTFTAYGQIYRNGTPVGTLRSTQSTTYVEFSEDISGWSVGENIELWIYVNHAGETVYVRNLELRGAHAQSRNEVLGNIVS